MPMDGHLKIVSEGHEQEQNYALVELCVHLVADLFMQIHNCINTCADRRGIQHYHKDCSLFIAQLNLKLFVTCFYILILLHQSHPVSKCAMSGV